MFKKCHTGIYSLKFLFKVFFFLRLENTQTWVLDSGGRILNHKEIFNIWV